MHDNNTARFSAGTDEQSASPALQTLLSSSSGGRWTLTNEGEALERSFKFKTFAKTWVSTQLQPSPSSSTVLTVRDARTL